MAARKSESTTLPIQILDDDHDDDDISLVYSVPPPPPSSWLSLSLGSTANNAISVENYNYYCSNSNSNSNSKSKPPLKKLKTRHSLDNAAVLVLDSQHPLMPSSSSSSKKSKTTTTTTTFTCEICADDRPTRLLFKIQGCTHSYCSHCILNYISSRLKDNIVQIRCPVMACSGLLEPYDCSAILPTDVLERWGTALCESTILDSHKFYCPFKDCSALVLMDDDPAPTASSAAVITQSECPYCRRLFCAQCKVPWHNGIKCEEFQKLGKNEREREDIMLMKLAKNNKWMRCSKCKFFVERTVGCSFMRCRCGHKFCYKCGATTVADHYCATCKR